jgi:hypothetical protein
LKVVVQLLILLSIINFGCKAPTEVIPEKPEEKKWEAIPEFVNMDIKYMLILNNILYIAAKDLSKDDIERDRGVIFRTNDGKSWERIKEFNRSPGPMTSLGDDLYVLLNDSIYYFNPDQGWTGRYLTPERLGDPEIVGDIVFIDSCLYGMQTFYPNAFQTFKIFPDGSNTEIFPRYGRSYAGAKFIKLVKNGMEYVYLRPHYYDNYFWRFDGKEFIREVDGLTERELISLNPTNSMAVHNDTLFAGFKYPASVKFLSDNNKWESYTDTLPRSKSWYLFKPELKTQTTALAFYEDRLFVATDPVGVLEWSKNNGWQRITKGLTVSAAANDESDEVFDAVVFLECYKGILFAGYGLPAYAPWQDFYGGEKGLYKFKIN